VPVRKDLSAGTALRDSPSPISKASLREFCGAKHHRGDISWPSARTYGQESNSTTRRLAIVNLSLRGIKTLRLAKWCCANRGINRAKTGGIRGNRCPCANTFGPENPDTFRRDLHPDYANKTFTS
jgi:hypothetical protein